MGTTLTGTTPQDTYDSLIKVTDNAPLTGSLKKLTDGLGNDSSLSLSTTAASLSGTLAVTGTSTFNGGQNVLYASFDNDAAMFQRVGTYGAVIRLGRSGVTNSTTIDYPADGAFSVSTAGSERMRITSAGNVGIGISAPTEKLSVAGNVFMGGTNANIYIDNGGVGGAALVVGVAGSTNGFVKTDGNFPILIQPNNTTRVRIDADGLKFNADTAAANALDDYEEGTFTYSITFGGGSTGITYNHRTGTYTKIGNKVTVNGLISLTNKGSDTGDARITGLPFTIPNAVQNYTAPSFQLFNITFANQVFGYGVINTTQISMNEMSEAGAVTTLTNADFANNSEVIIGLTYFTA